jgi:hypothetical protein
MPYLSQRLEAFFVYVTSFRAREAQNVTAIPPHLHKWLHAWGEARAAAGGSGDWTIGGGYIDDTVNMCYQFFSPTLMRLKRRMWEDFGLKKCCSFRGRTYYFRTFIKWPWGEHQITVLRLSKPRAGKSRNRHTAVLSKFGIILYRNIYT